MKQEYDFRKGKRGRIVSPEPEQRVKTRITIRLDEDLVDYFLKEAERSGGSAGYQTLINDALRQHVEGRAPKFEETLRRILRGRNQRQELDKRDETSPSLGREVANSEKSQA